MGSTPHLGSPQVPAYPSASQVVAMGSTPPNRAPLAAQVVILGSTPHHGAPLVALKVIDKDTIPTVVQTGQGAVAKKTPVSGVPCVIISHMKRI